VGRASDRPVGAAVTDTSGTGTPAAWPSDGDRGGRSSMCCPSSHPRLVTGRGPCLLREDAGNTDMTAQHLSPTVSAQAGSRRRPYWPSGRATAQGWSGSASAALTDCSRSSRSRWVSVISGCAGP